MKTTVSRFCDTKNLFQVDEFKRLPEIGDFSSFYVSIVCMRRPNDFHLYWAIGEILKYEPEYALHMFVDCFGIALQVV